MDLFTNYVYALPVFKHGPANTSGLGITNLSPTETANVTVTVFQQDGRCVATERKTLPARGQEAFVVGPELTDDGWIRVASDQPLAGVNFLGRFRGGNATDLVMGDVPFTRNLSTSLVIPHVAQDTTWDTTLFLANPNTVPITATLVHTGRDGTASVPYGVSIPARGSREIQVGDIAGALVVDGGSVTINASGGLAAFALYSNLKSGGSCFAGINAIDTDQ
ncbi:MAG: hypothetical protein V1793_09460 [Pseudomonadota bacterium]